MKTLRKQVSEALIARGFSRNGRGHKLRIDADFWWCVDTGPIGNQTDIAPFVGIRSDAIEHARADLMALRRDEWVATVIGNVGYVLGGEYKWWEGGTASTIIVDAISAGLERLRPFAALATIADAFTHRWASANPGAPYALVVAAVLNNDASLVHERLADAEKRLCVHPDEVCEQFQEFKARVIARLG